MTETATTPPAADLTPAMRQFQAVKARHPDCIVFFRIGDFYEIFYDDARTAARVLGIALTARSKTDNAVPMAGVPHHAVDGYLAKMLEAGYRVAVVEQLEDPRVAKGVIKRDVVRLITPGTLTDETLLTETRPNHLAAVWQTKDKAGLAWVELSTGQFFAADLDPAELAEELARIQPAECLLPEGRHGIAERRGPAEGAADGAKPPFLITTRPDWIFARDQAAAALAEQFGVKTLEGFGFAAGITPALQAAGAIVEYLKETQRARAEHIRSITPVVRSRSLLIDPVTLRSLEIVATMRSGRAEGSLLAAVDRTKTAMGARLLRQWLLYPLAEAEPIRLRQQAVAELLETPPLRRMLRDRLAEVGDMERMITRISCGRAGPRDLLGLGRSLAALAPMGAALSDPQGHLLAELGAALGGPAAEGSAVGSQGSGPVPPSPPEGEVGGPTGTGVRGAEAGPPFHPPHPGPRPPGERGTQLADLCRLIAAAIREDAPNVVRDGGVIRDGFDPELDRLRNISRDGRQWIAEFQAAEIKRTGIASLKVGFNNVFGYYIEITHAHRDKVPAGYVRKQTVKNAERYITEELKSYETEVLTAEERAKALEAELFERVRREVAARTAAVQQAAAAVAQLDVLCGFAQLAEERRYVRPEIVADPVLDIADGRHPVLDQTLAGKFVPNDVRFDARDCRTAVITGPNMAGKSTFIRQTAALVLLAHTGAFLPAARAVVGLADRIFARVGASDELARGQSTFMVEMTETANILHNATARSLVILDEIGRGTSTYDGLSLAWAITEHIVRRIGCRTLFATHYHELTELASALPGVANFNVAVKEWQDEIVFVHRIVPGGADKSYGIHVARLAGVPEEVIGRAREVLAELEGLSRRAADGSSKKGSLSAPSSTVRKLSRTAGRRDREQLLLFEDLPHPSLEKLRALDVGSLSAEQALETLRRLADEAKNG
jgi:DNA mismatch repair protein MutS